MGVYSNMAATAATSTVSPFMESVDPVQFAINAQRDNLELFEAMIEVDFAEAYNESGAIILTESDKMEAFKIRLKGIGDKIVKIFNDFIKAAGALINNVITKIKLVAGSDKKIIEKFGKYLVYDDLKECPAEGVTVSTKFFEELASQSGELEISKMMEDVEKLTTVEDVNSYKEKFVETVNSFVDKFSKVDLAKIFTKSEEPFIKSVTSTEFDIMVDSIKGGYKVNLETCRALVNAGITNVKSAINTQKQAMKSFEDNKEIGAVKATVVYELLVKVLSVLQRYNKFSVVMLNRMILSYRSNIVKLGTWAANKNGDKAATKTDDTVKANEAMCNMAGELSDLFVEEVLGL